MPARVWMQLNLQLAINSGAKMFVWALQMKLFLGVALNLAPMLVRALQMKLFFCLAQNFAVLFVRALQMKFFWDIAPSLPWTGTLLQCTSQTGGFLFLSPELLGSRHARKFFQPALLSRIGAMDKSECIGDIWNTLQTTFCCARVFFLGSLLCKLGKCPKRRPPALPARASP